MPYLHFLALELGQIRTIHSFITTVIHSFIHLFPMSGWASMKAVESHKDTKEPMVDNLNSLEGLGRLKAHKICETTVRR